MDDTVEKPSSQRGWWARNRKRVIIALVAVIAIAVIPPSALYAVSRHQQVATTTPPENNPSALPSPSVGDESARPNPHTPPISEPFPYGQQPIRGINLGGWLVIEPFITPSLFDQFPAEAHVIDEWTLCKALGPEEARRQLQHHYETFITEDDFKRIASLGFDHVRIPTGHWAIEVVDEEPYVPRLSWEYLLKGIQWARKYGLRVMVELHTAPGSQNGWNHSGRYGTVGWLNGTNGDANGNRTLAIVKNMTQFFSQPEWRNVVPIFGVINEPAIYRIKTERVKDWYRTSYDTIRQAGGGPSYLTYHDGFLGLDSWNGFFDQHYERIFLEAHMYLIFDDDLVRMPRDKQAAFPCLEWAKMLRQSMQAAAPTMVGEFSMATNDCGKYLNGVGLGTRYEGTYQEAGQEESRRKPVCPTCTNCTLVEDWRHWTDEYKGFLRSFIEHQMDAFESSSIGWFFWTYKTEDHINPHWDYLLGWEQGWVPPRVDQRMYSCSNQTTSSSSTLAATPT